MSMQLSQTLSSAMHCQPERGRSAVVVLFGRGRPHHWFGSQSTGIEGILAAISDAIATLKGIATADKSTAIDTLTDGTFTDQLGTTYPGSVNPEPFIHSGRCRYRPVLT